MYVFFLEIRWLNRAVVIIYSTLITKNDVFRWLNQKKIVGFLLFFRYVLTIQNLNWVMPYLRHSSKVRIYKYFDWVKVDCLATEATKEQSSEIRIQKFRLSMVWNKYDQVVKDLLKENKENTWTVSLSYFHLLDTISIIYYVGNTIRYCFMWSISLWFNPFCWTSNRSRCFLWSIKTFNQSWQII